MMESPTPISVVIPAYNAASDLPATLESLEAQTLPPGEVIVVDDGSSDDTAELARAWGARVLKHETNRGLSAARNTGIREARYEWIALLDADDLWDPEKLALQWAAVVEHPRVRVVACDYETFVGDRTVAPRHLAQWEPYRRAPKERLGSETVRLPGTPLGMALIEGHFLLPSTLLVRRDLLLEIGLYDEGFAGLGTDPVGCEDLDLNLRLARRTDPILLERPLVRYRLREGSLSRHDLAMALGVIRVVDRMERLPDTFPAGTLEAYRPERPKRRQTAGLLLMHQGAFARARPLLRESWAEAPVPTTAALLAMSYLGPVPFRLLRSLKRVLRLPGLR